MSIRSLVAILVFTLATLAIESKGQSLFKLKDCREDKKSRVKVDTGVQVFVFLNPECPLCQKYPFTLNKLFQSSSEFANWKVIVPGAYYFSEEVLEFCKEFGLDLPVFLDKQYSLTKALNASITPQVVLLKSGKVQYSGKIDDWPIELGKMRPVVSKTYLKDALEAVLAGRRPSLDYIEPVGCFIF